MARPGQHLYMLHRVMMSLAIAFCAGFAARETVVAARRGGMIPAALAVISGVGTVALAIYFRWWLRTKARDGAAVPENVASIAARGNTPHPST